MVSEPFFLQTDLGLKALTYYDRLPLVQLRWLAVTALFRIVSNSHLFRVSLAYHFAAYSSCVHSRCISAERQLPWYHCFSSIETAAQGGALYRLLMMMLSNHRGVPVLLHVEVQSPLVL